MKTRKLDLSKITQVIDPIIAMRQTDWYLVSATDGKGKTNALTAAWGGLGNVCEKPAATIYIRPQRFTKRFIDASGRFTMTFFDFEKYNKALAYMGSHSGADDPDKIKNAGLTLADIDGQPTYAEGKLVLLCKPFFCQQLGEQNFLDPAVADAAFPDKDFSYMYIAQIEAAYEILA
jgi:flavin reductase (DIM6/NTAB) family NADH-FMN oxidoreductase RutF